jgi:hypothetical protein
VDTSFYRRNINNAGSTNGQISKFLNHPQLVITEIKSYSYTVWIIKQDNQSIKNGILKGVLCYK